MINKEFIEKIEDMTGPKVIETVQGTFSDEHLYRVENKLADTIVLSSLSGLAEMIKQEMSEYNLPLFVRATSAERVHVFGAIRDDMQRERPFTAEAVPAGHEGENGLHCQSGLHNGQHDLVEGVELACTVDAGSLYDLHGKGSVQILLHEEEHGGRCNAGQDQRDKAVLQAHLGDELQKAQSGHLRGHGHDQQDNGERGLFEFEVIGVDAVGRQGREVHAERRRAGGDDQAVADAGDDRDVSIGQHVLEVGDERFARQHREAFLDLEVGAGGVDHQHIEEEQAQKADEHQHQITPCAACSQCCFFRLISRSVCHNHFPPFAAFLAAFSSLRWARVRPSSSLVREK